MSADVELAQLRAEVERLKTENGRLIKIGLGLLAGAVELAIVVLALIVNG